MSISCTLAALGGPARAEMGYPPFGVPLAYNPAIQRPCQGSRLGVSKVQYFPMVTVIDPYSCIPCANTPHEQCMMTKPATLMSLAWPQFKNFPQNMYACEQLKQSKLCGKWLLSFSIAESVRSRKLPLGSDLEETRLLLYTSARALLG